MMSKADFYLHDLASKFRKIDPMKYYLSYSGGKDSHLLYWFLKTWLPANYPDMEEYQKIPIVSVNTRMEWPEISDRMRKNADVVLIPGLKPHEVIAKFGTPCFSKQNDQYIAEYQNGCRSMRILNKVKGLDSSGNKSRFALTKFQSSLLLSGQLPKISPRCCTFLKKTPFHQFEKENNLHAILGMVGNESQLRMSMLKSCFSMKDQKFTPLWDLSEEVEEGIYQQYHIEVPAIYNYVDQTGCAGCPYGIGLGHTEKELALMTSAKRAYVCKLFADAYLIRGVDIHKPLQTVLEDYIPKYNDLPYGAKGE